MEETNCLSDTWLQNHRKDACAPSFTSPTSQLARSLTLAAPITTTTPRDRMDLLSKWKVHSPLQDDVDLEMLGPDLLSSRHPDGSGGGSQRKNTKTLALYSVMTMVLLIDEEGSVSLQEIRRSDILKMTHEAAKTSLYTASLQPQDSSSSNSKADAMRQPEVASPRREGRRSFTGVHGSTTGGAPAVHMRDLRKLDANFSETNEPCFAVRKQAILINAGMAHALTLATSNVMPSLKLHSSPDSICGAATFDPEVAEVILESYFQEIQTVRTKVKLLEHRIHNTESLVTLKLDATRNHLLAVDVLFGLITVSLTLGMNLRSGLEESSGVSASVFFGALSLCALLVLAGVLYFRRHGVLNL